MSDEAWKNFIASYPTFLKGGTTDITKLEQAIISAESNKEV